MNAVAITGIGLIVSGHGNVSELFSTLADGQSIIRHDKNLEALGIKQVPSGALDDGQVEWLDQTYPEIYGTATSVAGKMLFHSATEAILKARLEPTQFPEKHAMFIGINKNLITLEQLHSMQQRYDFDLSLLLPQKTPEDRVLDLLRPDQVVESLIAYWCYNREVQVHSDACSAGAFAVISGYRRIVSGQLDLAICGATEQGTQPIMQLMFTRLGALCRKTYDDAKLASRAFDKDRDGCVLSDGSAVLILENVEKARTRGVEILAYIIGAARNSEAFQMTSSSPDGELYAQCMDTALQDAGLNPQDVDHINAHGTSTVLNDAAESRAIYSLFNNKPSVISTKSSLGHSLAASSAIELALSTLTLQKQQILPSINYSQPSVGEPHLNIVKQSRRESLNYILSNSFGFGGENSSIVLARKVA